MTHLKIIKRDGRKVEFDLDKIKIAIQKAMYAASEGDLGEKSALSVTTNVLNAIPQNIEEISIEEVQDLVENALMESGYHKVAKAYILYREKQKEIRERNHTNSTKIKVTKIHNQELENLALASQKQFDYDPMRQFVYKRTYSRWIPELGRREFWQETVERFVKFIRSKIGDKISEDEYHLIFENVFEQKVMPSMRLLQFAGPAAHRCNVCVYNCSFSAPESFKDLADIMYLSMSGTGVGFSVEKHNVDRFPEISLEEDHVNRAKYIVADSKEGWCDSLQFALEEYFAGRDPIFDYSRLRPKGARLMTSGGRSSGPEPLKDLHRFIKETVAQKRREKLTKLSTLNVHDVICKIGQIVIAGGVRRCIAKGSKVITSKGDVAIEDLKIGDLVQTIDGYKPVIAKMKQGMQDVLKITHDSGVLTCTANHRVAVFRSTDSKDYFWKEASLLTKSDFLGMPSPVYQNKVIQIQIRDIIKYGKMETYDIEVEDNHNFVCSGVLVHNSALISISDLNDHEMRDCKSGPFWNTASQRFLANNSAVYNVKPSQIDFMSEWLSLAKSGSGERGIFNRSGLRDVMPKRRVEYLGKDIDHVGCNPCVTADTEINTVDGPKCVCDLIGKKTELIIDSKKYWTTDAGFWKSGHEMVYELKTGRNHVLKCTAAHRLEKHSNQTINDRTNSWVELKDLKVGDLIRVTSETIFSSYARIISITPLNLQDVYDCTVDHPDVHWYESNGIISHNCAEVLLKSFQFCNLTEVVCRADDTFETLSEKIRVATIIGTIQSSFSDYKYIDPKWKVNQDAERLLGVSLTGIWDCPVLKRGETDTILQTLRDQTISVNIAYSKQLGINASHAITCVKPSGTVSQMVNASSGIHPRFSQYYIRRIRISSHDPLLQLMKSEGYECKPEVGQVMPNVNTYVLEFPVASPEGAITVDQVSTIEQLEHWKRYKTQFTEHNPSVTIYVKPDEWFETGKWVWDNWEYITGLSFLPYSDHVYDLAPYEAITKEQYEEMKSKLKVVNFANLVNFEREDTTDVKKELACVGGACEL